MIVMNGNKKNTMAVLDRVISKLMYYPGGKHQHLSRSLKPCTSGSISFHVTQFKSP